MSQCCSLLCRLNGAKELQTLHPSCCRSPSLLQQQSQSLLLQRSGLHNQGRAELTSRPGF